MKWAIDNGVKLCFELDTQRVVEAMKNFKTDISEFELLLIVIKILLMILYLVHFLLFLQRP